MDHRYHICHGVDADYIVLESFDCGSHWLGDSVNWIEHTRWMIPGSHIED